MGKLIHVATIFQKGKKQLLYLRETEEGAYRWYRETGQEEEETAISANNFEEAIRLANREWKIHYFTPLHCGFRYTLHERDEHGTNALFREMGESSKSSNGAYFDPKLGHSFFVQNASREALGLWRKLEQENKL